MEPNNSPEQLKALYDIKVANANKLLSEARQVLENERGKENEALAQARVEALEADLRRIKGEDVQEDIAA